jgi:hypothetical protein
MWMRSANGMLRRLTDYQPVRAAARAERDRCAKLYSLVEAARYVGTGRPAVPHQ